MQLFTARLLLLDPERSCAGGGLLVRDGVVTRVLWTPGAVRRAARDTGARRVDLADGVLAPGLVNAHAHLELGGLEGELPRASTFAGWIRALLALRAVRSARELGADARRGQARSLATGTTAVGDVTSGAAPRPALGPRACVFREVLDAHDPLRTAGALAAIRRRLPPRALSHEGVSPHAPYTTSPALLAGVRALLRARPMPVQVHWSETREEVEWLVHGRGPLAELLAAPPPRRRGLALLAEAGLLGPRTSLVHGNHPEPGEPERIARAGSVLVHCPGSHAFFDREPFPWRRWQEAGVRVALGTDSLASNDELDMRREMALARRAAPFLAPARVWAMATVEAARALGLAGRAGALARGRAADLVLHGLAARTADEALEALTAGEGTVRATWVAGRLVHAADAAGEQARGARAVPGSGRGGRTGHPGGPGRWSD